MLRKEYEDRVLLSELITKRLELIKGIETMDMVLDVKTERLEELEKSISIVVKRLVIYGKSK